MDAGKCCVCDSQDVVATVYGGRAYCRGCLEKVTARRRGLGLYELAALALLIGAGALLDGLLGGNGAPRLLLSLLFLCGISLAFVILFYRQDRLEPEPKLLVALVFLGGAALHPFLMPLLEDVFGMAAWGRSGLLQGALLYALLFGLVVEYGKYLLVRHTIYKDEEFDEVADGVVYGSLAGAGFATAVNLGYVFGSGGVDLFVGTIRMATTVLIHASISGLVGYFLGRQKFTAQGPWGPALAIGGGGLLWGGYYLLTRLFTSSGLAYSPWQELLVLVVYSFLITLLTLFLMHRAQQALLAAAQGGNK